MPALVNPSTLSELGDVIGRERLHSLIDRFTEALAEAFSQDDRPAAEIGREAHKLVSMSGMLGCDALSAACRALEQHAVTGADIRAPLEEARRLRDGTIGALARQSPV
ncbi:Hpt domain-containing protein [Methylobacterium sp. NFXW15]|uniref:Hpt domain-containing protein n=1 Tax=Methylobacterium sp. NFXW15 TaxID=2819512 RepID=UPI003CF12260